jgi:hypothetical protein
MNIEMARARALELAIQHHGSGVSDAELFSTADRFATFIAGNYAPAPAAPNLATLRDSGVLACVRDPAAFAARMSIRTTHGFGAFTPYEFQADLIRDCVAEGRLIVAQARQMGVTHCLAASALWLATLGGVTGKIGVFLPNFRQAIAFMDTVRALHETLPDILREPLVQNLKGEITFQSGATIFARSAGADMECGTSLDTIIIPDAAYISHSVGETFWTALAPMAPLARRVIMTSTPNMQQGLFFRLYTRAETMGFDRVSLPWNLHPDRDSAWFKEMRNTLGEAQWQSQFECMFTFPE